MKSLVRLLLGNRRGGPREEAQRTVHLFDGERRLGTAVLLDQSPGGARLSTPRGGQPPEAFAFVEVDTALAHLAEVAWRSDEAVGVRVLRSQRLRGYVPADFAGMKRFWEQAAVITARG